MRRVIFVYEIIYNFVVKKFDKEIISAVDFEKSGKKKMS